MKSSDVTVCLESDNTQPENPNASRKDSRQSEPEKVARIDRKETGHETSIASGAKLGEQTLHQEQIRAAEKEINEQLAQRN